MLMLIPIYFQKFFHDSPPIWSIGYQYNIEFAPIMAIGIFEIISTFKNKIALSCSIIVLLFSIASTIRTMDNTLHVTNKSQIRFYQNIHYKKNYDIEPVHFNLKKIPSEANVSAQSPFVPHLSLRENIYQFPIIKDADYIVLSSKESTYPLSNEEFLAKVAELEKSQEWEKIYSEDVTILKRIHSH